MMTSTMFQAPVSVVVGLGLAHEIRSLDEMHEFLVEWTTSRRGPAHAVALEVCDAVRTGQLSVGYARNALVDFAKASHILLDDIDPRPQMAPCPPKTDYNRDRALNM